RMIMVREFHAQHRHDPGFADWFQRTRLLSAIPCVAQLLRLDLLGHNVRSAAAPAQPGEEADIPVAPNPAVAGPHGADWTGWGSASVEPKEEDLPLSVLLDEMGDGENSILAGRALRSSRSITL